MGAPIPLNQVARLRQRCEKINALYQKDRKSYTYCRSIFLHVDSRSKSHQTDVFFYHAPKSVNGKRLARILSNLNTPATNLTVAFRELSAHAICMCWPIPVLLECL